MRAWKLGCCGPVERMEQAKAAGFQYYELALAPLMKLNDDAFDALRKRAADSGLPVYALNVLMPGADLPVVGPTVSRDALGVYLGKAFARAAALGARVAVFGSGAARRCPDGFLMERALEQIGDFLRLCEQYAAPFGVALAIEPLNRKETNTLPRVEDAAALARALALPHIGALGDTYHMALEAEPLAALADARDVLWHVHIANPEGRVFPAPDDGYDYRALTDTLRAIGYTGGVSVEAGTENFMADAARVVRMFEGYSQPTKANKLSASSAI